MGGCEMRRVKKGMIGEGGSKRGAKPPSLVQCLEMWERRDESTVERVALARVSVPGQCRQDEQMLET
jgi:hypothetical protein